MNPTKVLIYVYHLYAWFVCYNFWSFYLIFSILRYAHTMITTTSWHPKVPSSYNVTGMCQSSKSQNHESQNQTIACFVSSPLPLGVEQISAIYPQLHPHSPSLPNSPNTWCNKHKFASTTMPLSSVYCSQ